MHEHYMYLAMNLAKKGRTGPNPRVGAVIVRDGRILGKGYHEGAGSAHAEVEAINDCLGNSEQTEGAEIYVNLEPCCHHGRTGPCCDAIIRSGFSKVYISCLDENPLVSGRGVSKLRSAGINVEIGILEDKAKYLNRGFFKRVTSGLPYVTGKIAVSLDGRYALDNGRSKWISSSESRLEVQRMRSESCAILTSALSLIRDDSRLNVRDLEGEQPLRIVIDKHNLVKGRIKNSDGMLLVVAKGVRCFDGEILEVEDITDLRKVLSCVTERYAINYLMLECGGSLLSSFLMQGLLDELVLFIAPRILGKSRYSLFSQIPPLRSLGESIDLKLREVETFGSDLKLSLLLNNE